MTFAQSRCRRHQAEATNPPPIVGGYLEPWGSPSRTEATDLPAVGVDDSDYGKRNQQSLSLHTDARDAPRWSHVGEEFLEHVAEGTSVLGSRQQGVDHDHVREFCPRSSKDGLHVEQGLSGLIFERRPRELACGDIDAGRPGHVDRVSRFGGLAVVLGLGSVRGRDDLVWHAKIVRH